MKAKFILALPLIALFAIPGEASQTVSKPAVLSSAQRLVATQTALGLMLDPHQEPVLSVTLPRGFTTLDVRADPFRS
jgi:hypothetical protein